MQMGQMGFANLVDDLEGVSMDSPDREYQHRIPELIKEFFIVSNWVLPDWIG